MMGATQIEQEEQRRMGRRSHKSQKLTRSHLKTCFSLDGPPLAGCPVPGAVPGSNGAQEHYCLLQQTTQ